MAGALVMFSAAAVGVVTRPPSASAAVFVAPFWVVYCSGCTAIVPRDGKPVRVPFGVVVNGTATVATVTLDTSGISASTVAVVGVEGPCVRSGAVITCTWRNIGSGTYTAKVVLQAQPGAAGGPAGYVKVSSSPASAYNPPISGKVNVSYDPSATDISISASATSGTIGGTATVTYVVRNNGPSVQPWVELSDVRPQQGTTFVNSNFCTVVGGLPQCRVDNVAVGAAVSIQLQYKITGCDTATGDSRGGGYLSWGQAYQDTYAYNEVSRFQIRVAGCSGGTSSGGSGSFTQPGFKPSPTAVPPTTTAPLPSPSSAPMETPSSAPVVAEVNRTVTPRASTSPWLLGSIASSILVVLGMVGLAVVQRRRRLAAGPAADSGATAPDPIDD